MEVQLIIKSPYQAAGDIKIDCDMLWSVGKVKEHLSALYPGKPRKEDQKLIYCGRLLLDHLQLKDILSQAQSVHTMHLVYPFPVCLDGNGAQQTKATNESSEMTDSQSAFPSSVNGSCPDGIRQRTAGSQQAPFGNYLPMHPSYAFPQAATSSPVSPVDLANQFTAMQQMYAQMMAQYLSQAQGGAGNFQYVPQATPASAPQQPPASIPAADIQDQPANNNRLAYPQEQQPQNNADEEAAAQDLLDWIYIMSRTMILFTILYFYSSLHRVLLVVSLGVLFFVYRAGVFEGRQRRTPPQRQANDRPNETQVNDPAQNNNGANDPAQNNTAADNQVTQAEVREDNPTEEQAVDRLQEQASEQEQVTRVVPESQISVQSVISVAVTFVTTFFTSLIPEQPVPVNVN